jgi:hypothetical protein
MSYSPPSYSSNHDYSESLFPISNPTPHATTSSDSYEFRLMNEEQNPPDSTIELKLPEELPDKINYSEKVAKKMDKTFQLHENIKPFTGSFYLSNLFYLYLFNKYKINCIIRRPNARHSLNIRIVVSDLIDPEMNQRQNEEIETYAYNIFACITRGEKIIILPFVFDILVKGHNVGAHANLLIYRRNVSELEHFEPHGSMYAGGGGFVNQSIVAFLTKLTHLLNGYITKENKKHKHDFFWGKLKTITLLKSHDVCPVIHGVQTLEEASTLPRNALIEPEGYCVAWSMFFTELCLKNPEASSSQVYRAILDKTELYENGNNYLRNVIRGYTCFINNKIAKHFSRVFGEPITSEKVHNFAEREKEKGNSLEKRDYFEKLLEIMEVETTTEKTDVKDRYRAFTQGIRRASSSSSPSPSKKESPQRKTAKGNPKKKKKGTHKRINTNHFYLQTT